MSHPGTFNANPLSAAAGITTLQHVADGEPNRRANATAWQLRQRLNALFAERGDATGWPTASSPASGCCPVIRDRGRPATTSSPMTERSNKLDGAGMRGWSHAFRQGMLLHGVDLPGLSAMTTAAHTEADVEQTVAAVAGVLDLLREEGLA